MTATFDLQALLGGMYRDDYQSDPIIQLHLVELGWALKRLLERGQINPFTDSEIALQAALKEMDWNKLNNDIKQRGLI